MTAIWQNQRSRIVTTRFSGSVLQWKRKFGWIRPDGVIHHPEASKNNRKVFVHVSDVVGHRSLYPGARVTFFVYADGRGLGAEELKLEASSSNPVNGYHSKYQKGFGKGKLTIQKTIDKRGPWNGNFSNVSKAPDVTKQPSNVNASDVTKLPSKVNAPVVTKLPSEVNVSPKANPVPKGKGKAKAKAAMLRPPPDRTKTTHEGSAQILSWASSECQGWRPAMEDASCALLQLADPLSSYALFAVFDGHGGKEVSNRAAAELPNGILASASQAMIDEGPGALACHVLGEALPAFDAVLWESGNGIPGFLHAGGDDQIESKVKNAYGLMGSTAIIALVECDGSPETSAPIRVTVANLGDSRAILCRAGEAIALSEDHKPDLPTERDRIEKAGGFVAAVGPCERIDGWGLNLSRALGDFHYKAREDLSPGEQKVSCVPDLCVMEITEDDEFLFLGCDGVFELNSNQDVVDRIRSGLKDGRPLTQVVEELVDASVSTGLILTSGQGADNVTAMVVLLRQ